MNPSHTNDPTPATYELKECFAEFHQKPVETLLNVWWAKLAILTFKGLQFIALRENAWPFRRTI